MSEKDRQLEFGGAEVRPAVAEAVVSSVPMAADPWRPAADPAGPTATRHDIQLARRLNHVIWGVAIAAAYTVFFDYKHITHIFGVVACAVYIADRIRVQYPELMRNLPTLNRLFFRAEEQLKESAMVPFVIAVLLTLLTFPKEVAIIAIFTLAVADPLAALVGIKFGRHRLPSGKTIEGSIVFFVATLIKPIVVFHFLAGATLGDSLVAAFLIALPTTIFEQIPLRLDDNLTIPLFVGFVGWMVSGWYLMIG